MQPFLSVNKTLQYLETEHGIVASEGKLAKMRKIGGGPVFVMRNNRLIGYRRADLDAWSAAGGLALAKQVIREREDEKRIQREHELAPWPKCPVVYWLQALPHGLVKIGHASQLRRRYMELCAQSPTPLQILGFREYTTRAKSKGAEKKFHWQFDAYRHHGEWFVPAPAVIKSCPVTCFTERDSPVERYLGVYDEMEKLRKHHRLEQKDRHRAELRKGRQAKRRHRKAIAVMREIGLLCAEVRPPPLGRALEQAAGMGATLVLEATASDDEARRLFRHFPNEIRDLGSAADWLLGRSGVEATEHLIEKVQVSPAADGRPWDVAVSTSH